MYWYEKENGALLRFEKDAFLQFMREYNHPAMKMMFCYDKKHRFCVEVTLPVKPAPDERWRTFVFHVVYEHNHPGRDSDGLFGGSIKVFPMTKLKPGFHHLITDSSTGIKYICQVRSTDPASVNGYMAMKRILRWIDVYCVWERTGVDIDR